MQDPADTTPTDPPSGDPQQYTPGYSGYAPEPAPAEAEQAPQMATYQSAVEYEPAGQLGFPRSGLLAVGGSAVQLSDRGSGQLLFVVPARTVTIEQGPGISHYAQINFSGASYRIAFHPSGAGRMFVRDGAKLRLYAIQATGEFQAALSAAQQLG
jgi:hypothetical protein